jgi:dephospho-CoA kinase
VSDLVYVFGYASLVALDEPAAVPGRLRGYRRHWGVAMDNWEGGDAVKHYLDPETGERPRIRVAYLDLYKHPDTTVNGVALPADAERLAALDAREVNYERVEVTRAFEPLAPTTASPIPGPAPAPLGFRPGRSPRVFTYLGLDAAHERCRQGAADGNIVVRRGYVNEVRTAFARLAPEAPTEFDRTTDPLPFPQRNLQLVPGGRAAT